MADQGQVPGRHHFSYFLRFVSYSDKFTRFCQWKNVELNIHVSGLGGHREPCSLLLLPREPGSGLDQGPAGRGRLPSTLSAVAEVSARTPVGVVQGR